MDQKKIIIAAEEFIQKKLAGDSTGHDWWHIDRVRNTALFIGKKEKADIFIVELAALLHDIADWKFSGDEYAGSRIAKEWMTKHNISTSITKHVCDIIDNVSFKGAGSVETMKSLEGKIVQDADRLDALGAIGIGRTFAYGGWKGIEMYNPEVKPVLHETFNAYKNSRGTTINHFHEKLLLLKDRMNTKTGKRIALKRHAFLLIFLKQFSDELKIKS